MIRQERAFLIDQLPFGIGSPNDYNMKITYHSGIRPGGIKNPLANPAMADKTGDILWARLGIVVMRNMTILIQV